MGVSFRRSGHSAVSGLLGLLLIAAAVLKAHEQAGAWAAASDFSAGRWLSLGALGVELVLGFWLLTGLYPRLARWLAGTAFVVFLAVSLTRAAAGETSCGCFGRVPVNPWITAGLDAVAVVALLLVRPPDSQGLPVQS